MSVGLHPVDVTVFWHRRDLRTTDDRGLAAAAGDGPSLPVFVLDDAILAHASTVRVAFRTARGE